MTYLYRQRLVEGINTRMVGREAELVQLQSAYARAVQQSRTHLVTIVGEAGVGKSRLWYEFENWAAAQPTQPAYLRGRAMPETMNTPYSILRDGFRNRFDILDSDSVTAVREKFETHLGPYLDDLAQVHLVGHLLGFDFSGTTAVRNLGSSESFAVMALGYCLKYFRNLSQQPTVIFLEDAHWADSASLDLLQRLTVDLPRQKLFMVVLARPALYARRADWGRDPQATRIDLAPLDLKASSALVDQILQKVEDLPERLREMILASAEGNPTYIEELIHSLVREGVIERGTAEHSWRVLPERLQRFTVPPTLTALLAARLGSLPGAEREMLQRAAVVGRIFWDSALEALSGGSNAARSVRNLLSQLRMREFIFPRERSTLKDAQEYIFKSTLLRDAAYESLARAARQTYHQQLARWFETNGRTRRGEYLALIAEHYEKAADVPAALATLREAGDRALAISAFTEARSFFERTLTWLEKEGGHEGEIAVINLKLGDTYLRAGNFAAAQAHSEIALTLARQLNAQVIAADALAQLGSLASETGDYAKAETLLQEALPLARTAGDKATLARALFALGNVNWRRGELELAQKHCGESLALASQIGDTTRQLSALNRLGVLAGLRGDQNEERRLYHEALTLAFEVGDRECAITSLNNLGALADGQGQFDAAQNYYQQAMSIAREIGAQQSLALYLINLGQTETKLQRLAEARGHLREGLALAHRLGALPWTLSALIFFARLAVAEGDPSRAIALLSVVQRHPANSRDHQRLIDQLLTDTKLESSLIDDSLARKAERQLQDVVAELTDGGPDSS